jgi:hypothetical protein
MSAFESLKIHWMSNEAFKSSPGYATDRDLANLLGYAEWLQQQIAILAMPDKSPAVRKQIRSTLADVAAFKTQFQADQSVVWGRVSGALANHSAVESEIQAPSDADVDLLFSAYDKWLRADLKLFLTAQDEMVVAGATGSEKLGIKSMREVLRDHIAEAEAVLGEVVAATSSFEDAARRKAERKQSAAKFIRQYKAGWSSGVFGDPTAAYLKALGEIRAQLESRVADLTKRYASQCARVQQAQKHDPRLIAARQKAQLELESATRDRDLAIDLSREMPALKDQKEHTQTVQKMLTPSKQQAASANLKASAALLSSQQQGTMNLFEREGYLRKNTDEFNALHARVVEDRRMIRECRARLSFLNATIVRLDALHKPVDDLRSEVVRLEREVTTLVNREAVDAASVSLHSEALTHDAAVVDAEIADIDLAARELEIAKRQLSQLRKLGSVSSALNVYCSFYDFAFPKMVSIGNLVIGDGAGMDWKDAKMKAFALELLTGLPPTAKLSRDFDTGELAIGLKLGVSWGAEASSVAAKVGLALAVEGALKVEDDRVFQNETVIKLVASAEVDVPKVFRLSLEAELLTDKVAMQFHDQYHWASWLCSKWARVVTKIRAIELVYGAQIYRRNEQRPDPDETALIDKLANELMASQPHIRQVIAAIREYENEAFTREGSLTTGAAVNGGIEVGGRIGATLELRRWITKIQTQRKIDDAGHVKFLERTECEREAAASLKFLNHEGTFRIKHVGDEQGLALSDPDSELQIKLELALPWVGNLGGSLECGPTEEESEEPLAGKIKELGELLEGKLDVINDNGLGAFKKEIEGALASKFGDVEASFDASSRAAVLQLGWVRSSVGDSSTNDGGAKLKWIYTRLLAIGERSAEASFPVGVGFGLELGMDFSFTRSYAEIIHSNSIKYIMDCYNQWKDRPASAAQKQIGRREGNAIWHDFAKRHRRGLWELFLAVGKDGTWPNREAKDIGQKGTLWVGICSHLTNDSAFDASAFDAALTAAEEAFTAHAEADEQEKNWVELNIRTRGDVAFERKMAAFRGFTSSATAILRDPLQQRELEDRLWKRYEFQKHTRVIGYRPFTKEDVIAQLQSVQYDEPKATQALDLACHNGYQEYRNNLTRKLETLMYLFRDRRRKGTLSSGNLHEYSADDVREAIKQAKGDVRDAIKSLNARLHPQGGAPIELDPADVPRVEEGYYIEQLNLIERANTRH